MSRALGLATVTILGVVQRRVRYGLDIAQETGLLPGTVYTTLRRLERRGLVEGRWEDADVAVEEGRPRRRYYALTKDGELALEGALQHYEMLGVGLGHGLTAAGPVE